MLRVSGGSRGGSWGAMEPPFCQHVTTLHSLSIDNIYGPSVSCDSFVQLKLASKPFFSDTSTAKPTVETVLDLELNDQIMNFLSRLSSNPCNSYGRVLTHLGISLW